MSSREPMWYCHQCHAEMRPLMVPDPVCASCRGSFVEKMDDPSNDPREFSAGGVPGVPGEENGMDNFFVALQSLFNRGSQQQSPQQQRSPIQPSSQRVTFQFSNNSPGGGGRSFTFGTTSPPIGSPSPNGIPTMSEFVRQRPTPLDNESDIQDGSPPRISGPLFAHYLLSLLGQNDHPMLPLFVGGMPDSGRMGDYVFSQEALDQIITQIMESSNAHRPVPASEDVVQKLPREVLLEGSPLLSNDCAVCKEQFQLGTEDPDELVIITLPCKHPFHQPCILPWLKSSGTCPVCRYALVPQPSENGPPNNSGSSSASPPAPSSSGGSNLFYSSSPPPRARSQSPIGHRSSRSGGGSSDSYRGGSGTGIFTQIFGNLAGLATHGGGSGSVSSTSSMSTTPSSPPQPQEQAQRRHRSSVDGFVPLTSTSRASSHSHTHSYSHSSTPTFGGSSYREREQQQRDSSQSSSNRTGSRRRGNGRQSPRPHVPGQWTDDMMDLD